MQQKTIPVALAGRDVLATAQTGTGKTGAFGIPLLTSLFGDPQKQALILAPTRELAAQIFTVLKDMGRGLNRRGALVVGGESFGRQIRQLEEGCDFIVATPGRLNDHLGEGTVDLSFINVLVLDEVDRMLDMGFAPQIKQILEHVPADRQTMLFSATLPKEIEALAKKFQSNPERIALSPVFEPTRDVKAETVRTTPDQKANLVVKALAEREGKILVFARTQSRTDRLAKLLSREGHNVVCLHGGRSQSQRKFALDKFRSGSHRIMVATDLAGRGIDVADVEHVINFDIPMSREDYIHRIGRTGRAGKSGSALNFLTREDSDGEFIVTGVRPPRGKHRQQGPANFSQSQAKVQEDVAQANGAASSSDFRNEPARSSFRHGRGRRPFRKGASSFRNHRRHDGAPRPGSEGRGFQSAGFSSHPAEERSSEARGRRRPRRRRRLGFSQRSAN